MQNLISELRGNIYSKVTKSVIRELKYSNKQTFHGMRYITHLDGPINLKSLFIKHNNNKCLFYYNLKSISNGVIVESNENLQYVPMLFNKLSTLNINYAHCIEDTYNLIPIFIKSTCQYMTVSLQHYVHPKERWLHIT